MIYRGSPALLLQWPLFRSLTLGTARRSITIRAQFDCPIRRAARRIGVFRRRRRRSNGPRTNIRLAFLHLFVAQLAAGSVYLAVRASHYKKLNWTPHYGPWRITPSDCVRRRGEARWWAKTKNDQVLSVLRGFYANARSMNSVQLVITWADVRPVKGSS